MLLETEERAELVGQETYRFSVKNPFPAHDPRRMRVDTKRMCILLCLLVSRGADRPADSTRTFGSVRRAVSEKSALDVARRDAYSSPAQYVECGPTEQGLHQAVLLSYVHFNFEQESGTNDFLRTNVGSRY